MASIASPEASPSVDDSTTVIALPVVKHGSENKGILTFTLEKSSHVRSFTIPMGINFFLEFTSFNMFSISIFT